MEFKKINKTSYKRPLITKTDRITIEDIENKLEDYIKVSDLTQITLGTHIRYFIIEKNGNKKYRPGGFLIHNDGLPKYIRLTNNKITWSVQVNNTVFFRKMTSCEIKKECEEGYEEYINNLESKIKKLKKKVKMLTFENANLKIK
jgi:hypothetical protein